MDLRPKNKKIQSRQGSVSLRSLDQFYRYVEQRGNGNEPTIATADIADKTQNETDNIAEGGPRLRYVIRNGVTIPIPPPSVGNSEFATTANVESQITEIAEEAIVAPVFESTDFEDARNWQEMPQSLQILAGLAKEMEAQPADPRDDRRQLIDRLINPMLSLEDTARLLGVCTATVRRWSNKGTLPHHRTIGQQRRFYLVDVLACLEQKTADDK